MLEKYLTNYWLMDIHKKNSSILYIKIDNNYIFNKGALDKWLETAKVEIK